MNGAVVLAMLLFMYSSFRHVVRGVTASHKASTSGFGERASGQAVFVDTLYSVIESMAVTVVALFVIINGANLALSIATGTQGMFTVTSTEALPKLLGPFGGVAASLQSFASLGIILLGAGVAVWKTLGVLRENYYGSHRGGGGEMNADGEMGASYGDKPAMHRTQALVKELAFVLALTILGYVVIRQGPNIVLSFLSGLSSVVPPTGFVERLAAVFAAA